MNPLRRRGTTTATSSAQRSKSGGGPHEHPPGTLAHDLDALRAAFRAVGEAYVRALTPAWVVVKDTAPVWLTLVWVAGVVALVTGSSSC